MAQAVRLLVFSRYGRLGSSSRVRILQYLPLLEAQGFAPTVQPLFDDRTVNALYAGSRMVNFLRIQGLIRRVLALTRCAEFDVIWVERELLPYLPAWPELYLRRRGLRMVADYDDAVFHNYDDHRHRLIRGLLGDKVADVMRCAAFVIVGNEYLKAYAEKAGARRIELVPTVVDLTRYAVSPPHVGIPFTIGWIGTPLTARYLKPIQSVLASFCRERDANLTLIGAGQVADLGTNCRVERWSEEGEVEQIQRFDVGIMPLPDEPFERGKCGYKLIQYMACGIPVIASPIGVNTKIVRQGIDGFLARTHEEWYGALEQFYSKPEMRRSMGLAARKRVESEYSLQVAAPRLCVLLKELTSGGGAR